MCSKTKCSKTTFLRVSKIGIGLQNIIFNYFMLWKKRYGLCSRHSWWNWSLCEYFKPSYVKWWGYSPYSVHHPMLKFGQWHDFIEHECDNLESIFGKNLLWTAILTILILHCWKHWRWNCLSWQVGAPPGSSPNRGWKLYILARCLTVLLLVMISLMRNFLNFELEEVNGKVGYKQSWVYHSLIQPMAILCAMPHFMFKQSS